MLFSSRFYVCNDNASVCFEYFSHLFAHGYLAKQAKCFDARFGFLIEFIDVVLCSHVACFEYNCSCHEEKAKQKNFESEKKEPEQVAVK